MWWISRKFDYPIHNSGHPTTSKQHVYDKVCMRWVKRNAEIQFDARIKKHRRNFRLKFLWKRHNNSLGVNLTINSNKVILLCYKNKWKEDDTRKCVFFLWWSYFVCLYLIEKDAHPLHKQYDFPIKFYGFIHHSSLF